MSVPRGLYALLDVRVTTEAFVRGVTDALCRAGAAAIEVQRSGLNATRYVEITRTVIEVARDFDTRVVAEGRPDLARLAGASGVRLGADDVDAHTARAIGGDDFWVGVHAEDDEDAVAVSDAADFVALAPTAGESWRRTDWSALRRAALRRPVIALGGLTLDDAARAHDAGAIGIALGEPVLGKDTYEAARRATKGWR